ncbi:MAG: hypothetical protein AMXMBFR4_28140 [Candidatus Hydrogenedentota bacterium]
METFPCIQPTDHVLDRAFPHTGPSIVTEGDKLRSVLFHGTAVYHAIRSETNRSLPQPEFRDRIRLSVERIRHAPGLHIRPRFR